MPSVADVRVALEVEEDVARTGLRAAARSRRRAWARGGGAVGSPRVARLHLELGLVVQHVVALGCERRRVDVLGALAQGAASS